MIVLTIINHHLRWHRMLYALYIYIYHINTMIHKYNNIRDLYDLSMMIYVWFDYIWFHQKWLWLVLLLKELCRFISSVLSIATFQDAFRAFDATGADSPDMLQNRKIFKHFSIAIWFFCDFPFWGMIFSCDARLFRAPRDPCRLFQRIMTNNSQKI